MKSRRPFVSDHDVLAFLAEAEDVDVEAARAAILEIAEAHAEMDGPAVVHGAVSICVRGGVVLVGPAKRSPRKTTGSDG